MQDRAGQKIKNKTRKKMGGKLRVNLFLKKKGNTWEMTTTRMRTRVTVRSHLLKMDSTSAQGRKLRCGTPLRQCVRILAGTKPGNSPHSVSALQPPTCPTSVLCQVISTLLPRQPFVHSAHVYWVATAYQESLWGPGRQQRSRKIGPCSPGVCNLEREKDHNHVSL